ncbi:MAG TPA: hypothetical protein DEO70_12335 [Bacteroidales bacterium]|nr:hypothetical protein [Bacteroidales bacterium]
MKKNAESQVLEFYSAVREGNEEKMKALYKGATNLSSYYKSDTATIKEIMIVENNKIEIKTINQFTNGYGKKFNQEIDFYLKPDSVNELDYIIYDSKGLCGYDDNSTYSFGMKTGCISKGDKTDQEIAKKLKIADELLLLKSLDVYLDLKKNVNIVNWSWESGYGGSASGKGIVKNASTFNLPDLKYKITYKDYYGNEITTDDGSVTYDKFYAGESKSFTFYTSYVGDASKASIELVFDDKMIMDYVASKDYTGKEYQEYIATRDSTKKN